jgi:alpha-N-arabinofuranosidase
MKTIFGAWLGMALTACLHGAEFQVATNGSDANPGTQELPFRTIQQAANRAQPGDVITVHGGVYRERINPPRGGISNQNRIVYQAAPGELVEIKGSEVITNWVKVQEDVWRATLPNSFFGSFNPYNDLIHGDWFNGKGREHHTGAVYLNGDWLTEGTNVNEVLQPPGAHALWYGQVDATNTTIWAQFKGVNPNEQLVEINVRRTVFYPEKTGVNYLTVRGFHLSQAATPWAPPTAEQFGVIGTHWSRGWIIENNVVSHSICCGISIGKYGDQFDNTSANSAEGYDQTIERARANGWNAATIGHHLVRNNVISDCEQAGIVGSLGCSFSTITGNTIHDIHVRQLFTGAEMAGIKLHGAIDVEISHNHIYRTCRGIWLDWMAQGTRVSGNLLHDNNTSEDLFVEVDHGPFLVDNNLFLSHRALLDNSQGGAYVHNLIAGTIHDMHGEKRRTPYLMAHSTSAAGMHGNPTGDDRFYNNLLVKGANLSEYNAAELPMSLGGNVFLAGAKPATNEPTALVVPGFDPGIRLVERTDGWYLDLALDPTWATERTRPLVTTALLGKAAIPNLPYENPDGSPLKIDTDYFGKQRDESNPFPGPFELRQGGKLWIKVWPRI